MATRMQQRKGTAAQWISTNSGQGPVLNAGEIGFEMDTNKFKIGDGVNHWVDLNYFIDGEGALAEVTALIDGAPAALNTLNELAAAINDDPTFFTTIATNLSNHQSDTTNIHGIADTSLLATTANVATAVSTAASDATTKANAAQAAASTDATTKANAARDAAISSAASYTDSSVASLIDSAPGALNTLNELAAAINDDASYAAGVATALAGKAEINYVDSSVLNHNSDTTSVHGIADTSALETQTGAQSKVDSALSAHNSDTTNVHGIADTSALETQTGAQSKIDASLSTHNADTTNVHGIADTSALATKTYADDAVALAAGTAATALSTHNSDTTNVHGIADTSVLATNASVNDAIDDHNLVTLNVHGIADTEDLTTNSDVDAKISAHNLVTTNVHGIDDTAELATQDFVATAVSNSAVDQSTLAGRGLDWDANDEQFIIDEQITATRVFAASLLTEATKNNIIITGDEHGLTITAENGVGDSTTDALNEGSVNKYFTDERAQDAVGNSVGTGLNYTDSTGEIKVDTTVIQARVANVNDTEIGYLDGVTSGIQSQIDAKLASSTAASTYAPIESPTFTGTVSGVSKSMVGLGNVDNTSDASKPVSTATQTALDLKATIASPDLTGVPTAPTATAGNNTTQIATTAFVSGAVSDLVASAPGALNTLNELAVALGNDANFSTSITNSIATKAPLADPTFTGTVSGVTKTHVGLGNVDNTTDANKPISTATQTALDLKAPLANPTFTGTVTLPANTISQSMMSDDSVGTNEIGGLAVTEAKIADGAVTSIKIANDTIVNADINSAAAISLSKLATDPLARANHTGSQTASTISDFDTQVRTSKVTDLTAPTGSFSMNSQKITNLATPTDSTDAATKQYVDNTASGVVAKPQVLGATTANIDATYSNGTAGVGATLTHNTNGEFPAGAGGASGWALYKGILVKNQTNKAQNGRYYISDMGSPSTPYVLTRCGYCDEASEIPGAYIFVQDGTFAGTGWIQVVADPATFVVGTDNIDVFQFSGSGTITAGTGITVSGNEVSISTGAITSSLILDGTIVDGDINASAAIAQSKVSGLTSDLAAKAPTANPTFTGTVAGITKSMVGLGNVDNTSDANKPISTATQTALDLKAPLESPTFTGSVTLPSGTVTSGMIADGTIVDADINASAAIAQSKISGLTSDLNLKAPLASPALTGTPTAPTATAGTNTTQVATTAFVGTAVANLVASAPSTLDTLNELATALGNDASFSTTVTTSIATKAPIASPTFTGTATIPTLTLTNPLTAANGGTGLSSLGTGVATFLGTPSSANLAAMLTDEIGTGNIVLSEVATTSPTAGSYTLVATDRGKLVEMSGASANTLTVPLHSTIPYPRGTQIDILQIGTGQTTVAGAAGVTVNATPGLKIRAQWGGATLIKRDDNVWVLIGDLTV